jgi:hypothetical protein
MKNYYAKSTNGFYNSEVHGTNIPPDAVEISDILYRSLLDGQSTGASISSDNNGSPILTPKPPPAPEEITAQAERKAEQDLKAAAKMDAIFTDIATDTLAQLVHKIEVQFPNPTFTNQQQKLLKVCLVAAALSLRGG